MAASYGPGARFHDPVFGELSGDEPGDMWRMLTGRAEDLKVSLMEHSANGDAGTARWIARYTFSTGRAVVNDVKAEFRFTDGRIVEHVDSFSFYAWARQALGPTGLLLGWAPPLRHSVRKRALGDLARFRQER
ncbi:MAG: nuclear transport factor 2 family protein [Solirubrobacterales bacterium]|nr:nuclear transport factor 2 family protein [Solirubrobacterales bacterium]